jgi:hypothetical protein
MAVNPPQLVGKHYVGFSLPIGHTLATFSLLSLAITVYCTFYSLKEAFEDNFPLIVLPSIPLYTGGHLAVRAWYTVSHLILNVIGSVIVAMSSYFQQLCVAPSYEVIRTAVRSDGGDVPFGSPVPTIVGVFRRFRRSVPVICVWALLLSTSLVMHLCLNGIVGFQYHIQTYDYNIIPANDLNPIFFTLANWTNATATQCQTDLRTIVGAFNVEIANITLIVDDTAPLGFLDYFGNVTELGPNGTQLNPNWNYIRYCFENKTPAICTLTARWAPLAVFTGVLILKSIGVLISLRYMSHFRQPLYTSIGELLQLAIHNTDARIVSATEALQDGPLIRRHLSKTKPAVRGVVRKLAWWRLMLISDWVCYAFQLFSFAWAILAVYESTVTYLPVYSTRNIFKVFIAQGFGTPERPLWTYNLGGVDDITSSQLTALVFLANSDQLWLAIGVFCANNHFTRIWLEGDWRKYYMRQRNPRVSRDMVSDPTGTKKPRKVAPVPYWITVSQLILGAAAHWLLSEAFFVVEAFYRPPGSTLSYIQFYVTHSPGVMAIGGLCFFTFIILITAHMLIPRWREMPVMNGSVRVVLASCTRLTRFGREGIAWGTVDEKGEVKEAGFAPIVTPLTPGNYGGTTIVDDGTRAWTWRKLLPSGRVVGDRNMLQTGSIYG